MIYLDRLTEKEFINDFGIREAPLPEVLKKYGIRSMTVRTGSVSDLPDPAAPDAEQLIFQQCLTIAFDNWADLAHASDLWDKLLTELIKPLKIKGLDLVFYLGDPGKMRFFQVDEVLDIISDFSKFGKVTFMMNEIEAGKLWGVLNGKEPVSLMVAETSSAWKEKFLMIFRTMTIHRLLIYSEVVGVSYAEEEQFTFVRRKAEPLAEVDKIGRDRFITGFSMGLIMGFEISQIIALGLILYGELGESGPRAAGETWIGYIERWMNETDRRLPV